jgi:hypothetical protein
MSERKPDSRPATYFRAGDWVEVRSREEILATLGERGRLENLPFMPEMLQYCGRRLRVYKRADKTCDYIAGWNLRRLENSVHLEGVRCDGEGHGGCQAGCLIFWKEAWLKPIENDAPSPESFPSPAGSAPSHSGPCTVEKILAASQTTNPEGETIYSCQALEVRNFTSPMSGWDPRQYIRDLRSGNLASGLAGHSRAERLLELVLGILQIFRSIIITAFNKVQGRLHGIPYPYVSGSLTKTPVEVLDLQPGELVQVRSKEEIVATLDKQNRNRGLWFDVEMVPYCGGIYRVLRRVTRIIDEKTGKMINMKYPCIVLDGAVCRADFHRLCPRAIYAYWRESWLKRAATSPVQISTTPVAETCERR